MAEKTLPEAEHLKARHSIPDHDAAKHEPPSDPDRTSRTDFLRSARLSGRGNASVRASMMQLAQQTYGNRAVQRMVRTMSEASQVGELGAISQVSPTTAGQSAATPVQRAPDAEKGKQPVQDWIVQLVITAIEKLDAEIRTQLESLKHSEGGKGTDSKSQDRPMSIDIETKKLERMINKRNQLFGMMSNIMNTYDESAKKVINNIR